MTDAYAEKFAARFGEDYSAYSFWKGRVALYAILKALELQPGDEVVLPAYTCVVVPNVIRHAGAKPIYADIEPMGYNLDPESVAARLTRRTRALIVQHTYGIPAQIGALKALADQHRLCLIEDCAHVLPGSKFGGKLLGSIGDAAFFSSQWSKPYTTGLGGVALVHDPRIAKRLKDVAREFVKPSRFSQLQLQLQYLTYRNLFRPRLYWRSQRCLHAFARLGVFVGSSSSKEITGARPDDLCWRMGSFQKHAGLIEIGRIGLNSAHRRWLNDYYTDVFTRKGWPLHGQFVGSETTLLRFPLEVTNKAALLKNAARSGVEIGSWFETPLHPLPLADHHLMEYRLGSCPVAERTASRTINLPLHERVTRADAENIANFVFSHALPPVTGNERVIPKKFQGTRAAI